MFTITQLARQCDVSRTTVLYYERAGLLEPASRTESGYRTYSHREVERLKSILSYRSFGVPVSDIAPLLETANEQEQEHILRRQFNALENEIQKLRKQQKAIFVMLNQNHEAQPSIISKERWVEMMAASGMSEDDMTNWHIQFEKMEPDAHQRFLTSLGIDENEISQMRKRFSSET
ncbi:MerR family transcriptional regulator [Photobacterium jeanii]|uniref:MerR family transcriptional regulator n=1 Tax=Photobacterium jeanii TaxID=858640 RepID=A0A178K6N8_9GAMM|nr:MerR family transcriptional regulator [Photobacterium jeanii]OAN12990.1 MerR family transcriptional regulator [Photobacterium jeanii]PST89138.1 MerR family DNA-binding transcriptional regulator [Photobacterium jeanii]